MKHCFVMYLYIIILWSAGLVQLDIVRYWGEECFMDNDCTDHRQSCVLFPENGIKKCECDNFHVWDENLRSCNLRYNTTHLLTFLQEQHNTTGWIENEALLIFNGALYAGLIVILITIGCFLSIILYCNHVRNSDKKLKSDVKDLLDDSKANNIKQTTCVNKTTKKSDIVAV